MSGRARTYKTVARLVVYVPAEYREDFVNAISPHIPRLGNYDYGLWWCDDGVEQFRPLAGSTPVCGETGEILRKPSSRIELIWAQNRAALERFIEDVIIPHHQWEQPVLYIQSVEIRL